VVDGPPGPSGERQQVKVGKFDREKDAEAALELVQRQMRTGEWAAPSRQSLRDFIEDTYLPSQVDQLKPSTLESYTANLRNHVLPTLGHRRLQDLTATDLNGLYAQLRDDAKLSPRTRRYVHTIIRRALALAVKWGEVGVNVADRADPPPTKLTKPQTPRVWTGQQLTQFLGHVAGERDAALWAVLAETGARRGEVLGLQWSRVDLEAGTVLIDKALVRVNGKATWGTPKTVHGIRTITLPAATVALLKEHRKQQASERLMIGAGYLDQDLVFANPDGSPLHADAVTKRFQRLAKHAGLPQTRLHDLRHAWGTHAHHLGVPIQVVSTRLGHHSPAFTLSVYTHGADGADAAAAELVAAKRGA
jgi:integrase